MQVMKVVFVFFVYLSVMDLFFGAGVFPDLSLYGTRVSPHLAVDPHKGVKII